MDDEEMMKQDDKVEAAAEKLGLSLTPFGERSRDYSVAKDGQTVGRLYFTYISDAEQAWDVVPGYVSSHDTLKDSLKDLTSLSRKEVFTVMLEYDKNCNLTNEQVNQMADVLSELAFAFRHKLTPDGLKFKNVVVKGRGGEAERKA